MSVLIAIWKIDSTGRLTEENSHDVGDDTVRFSCRASHGRRLECQSGSCMCRPRRAAIPIRMGGTSGTALKFAGRHADMFELTPGTPEEVVKLMERTQVAAAPYGREDKMRFALPVSVGALRQPFQILRLQNSMPLPKKSTFLVRQCKSARNWSLHVHRC